MSPCLLKPDVPEGQPLRMATGAEVSALARELQQELVLAGRRAVASAAVNSFPGGAVNTGQ